jgi:serine/threonine protein kinase
MHIEAETDMDVWVIHRDQFKEISTNDPDLNTFLTELIADRFDSKRPTAERTIGKYIATEIVGRGGYSIVYKGLHSTLNMPVAIKMMRHDLAMQPEFIESFHNEAKIIASLNHENIIKVFDIEERYRTVFIIMEYLEGESLKAMLKRLKTIPSQLAAAYIHQICSALEYANQKELVHRDINPSNVIVSHNDRIKLIDFGLACPTGTDDCYFGGALPYMSPELIDGDPPDVRSDIYSLGITAFELITGSPPFPNDNNRGIMEMIRNEDIPDPKGRVPDIPVLLRDFIIKACRRDPSRRYQDMRETMEAIHPLLMPSISNSELSGLSMQNQVSVRLSYDCKYQQEYKSLIKHFQNKIIAMGGHITIEDIPLNKK